MRSETGRRLLAVGLLAGVLSPAASASEGEGIRVVHVTPAAVDGMLSAGVQCEALFSPRSLSTLQSGLPAVLSLEMRLMRKTSTKTLLGLGQEEFETVRTVREAKSIRYDVWDERCTVRGRGETQVFGDVAAAEVAAATFAPLRLAPLTALEAGATYRVRARVQLLPISPEQGDRIADWLRDPDQVTGGSGPVDGGSFGFDVNGLLSALWGRGKPTRDRSEWYESPRFRMSSVGELKD